MVETWREKLDQNSYMVVFQFDLLKPFDCIPHDLLILRLMIFMELFIVDIFLL